MTGTQPITQSQPQAPQSGWQHGWKTITGVILIALGILLDPQVLAVLPPKIAGIVQAIGVLLAGYGIRVAITNNGVKQ